jgi:type II secretory pathway pseudopilin PulG
MAALLVSMSIVALLMTAAMPVWKQMVQREKEEELVFRGQQYVHAITLYGRKFANTQPPSVDVLVQQRFLRKKYKDPITNDDFQLILAAAQGAPGAGAQAGSQQTNARGAGAGGSPTPGPPAATAPQAARGISPIGTPGAGPVGGIMGVTSKSKSESIRLYNGRTHYNEWVFLYQPQQTAVGGSGVGGRGGPGFPAGAGVPGGGGPFSGSGRDGRGNRGGGRSDGPGGRGPGPPPSGLSAPPFAPRGRL